MENTFNFIGLKILQGWSGKVLQQETAAIFPEKKTRRSCQSERIHVSLPTMIRIPDCKPAVTEKYLAGDTVLSSNQLGRDGSIGSFHNCNEEEGSNRLNIDMTEFQDPFSSGPSPVVLESYRNVCSCVNVPEYVQNMDKWSVNNHHNVLVAYYEQDCLENKRNSTFIAAGHNFGSHNMREHDKADEVTMSINPIQSLGPDKNSAYFQISCNSSYVTMGSKNATESKTANKLNVNAEFDRTGFQRLSSQIGELQTQVIELKRNQEMFYAIILEQLRNMTFSCNKNAYRTLTNLEGLFTNHSRLGDQIVEENGGSCSLKKLDFHPWTSLMKGPQLFQHLQVNWWDTLIDLKLGYPFTLELEVQLEQSKNLRLGLPRLRSLSLQIHGLLFLDFILPLRNCLEHLEVNRNVLINEQVEMSERVKKEQIIEFHGFEQDLCESNIWELFQKLKTIMINGRSLYHRK